MHKRLRQPPEPACRLTVRERTCMHAAAHECTQMQRECTRMHANAQDIWCIGQFRHLPAFTPANQCIERWHKKLMEYLKGQLRASMEHCLEVSLPKIFLFDTINMPDTINYSVDIIPKEMLEKAAGYVDKEDVMVGIEEEALPGADGEEEQTVYVAYVLRNKSKWDTLSEDLIKMCVHAHFAHLSHICVHFQVLRAGRT